MFFVLFLSKGYLPQWTLYASMRLLSTVYNYVLLEMLRKGELFGTLLTSMWILYTVYQHVLLQIKRNGE